MVLLLLNQLPGKSERCANLFACQAIFGFNFRKLHAAGEAADHERNRHPGAAYDRLAVANIGINDDLIVHNHILALVGRLASAVF